MIQELIFRCGYEDGKVPMLQHRFQIKMKVIVVAWNNAGA
jgi:hypothetical protein